MNYKIFFSTAFFLMVACAMIAQPSPVKKASKSFFTITTYSKDGTIKSTGQGVFVGNNGEAIGAWSPFAGAASAKVVDANGKTMTVETIIGANELYDVCKFRVNGNTTPALIDGEATDSETIWLAQSHGKKTTYVEYEISKVEKFMDKYSYYILHPVDSLPKITGCPFLNSNGQVIGLLQMPKSSDDIHAVDTRYINDQKIDGLSINKSLYKQTGIRLDMPTDIEQAQIMMMMAREQCDSLTYTLYIDDFIKKFPHQVDGYSTRAMNCINDGQFEQADKTMLLALSNANDKAEAHAEYSRMIYNKLIYSADTTFTAWTFDKALEEIRKAYDIDPKAVYKHREAQIIFAKGEYDTALPMFMNLTKEELNNEELYFEAAQCKKQLGATGTELIELLDSAVASCPKPLTSISAPYVLARGQQYEDMGELRKAISDYNTYDTLMAGRASAVFYYTKYKCEVNARQYQQALNDIAHAAYLEKTEPLYYAEMASLQLRVNKYDEAIQAADMCIDIDPESSDAYIIKGIALEYKQEKEESIKAFEKAKELGDERAQELMDRFE